MTLQLQHGTHLLHETRPISARVATGLLAVLSIGGLYGGSSMLADKTGDDLGLTLEMIENAPVADYLVPGYLLFFGFGLLPIAVAFGLSHRHERFSVLGHDWAWTAGVALGVALVGWMIAQLAIIGYRLPIQAIMLATGLALTGLLLSPRTRAFYRRREP